ncbi:outer membrane beta-barrel family protein [Chitinophaga sp. CF118]|uniref:outer membrane beta-barrel family protein n=1 Tax=Chitinophaga sp. CF118 TaxID=1884367 RepID=UPI0015A57804|nr:outer membrane beta-barrel family protein [Chitinophaga sp. CF118]
MVFAIGASAQAVSVAGRVIDETGQPVAFASVVILKGSLVIGEKIASEDGSFKLMIDSVGRYVMKIRHTSYVDFSKEIQLQTSLDSEVIVLKKSEKQLREVTITASKPFVTRKIDRVVMNVQDNAIATGKSSIDLFRLAPGVFINNGNISINGVWGTRVMVNGRMLNLKGDDLKNYLANLKSNDIKSIEIIAHPPAEYDAEGSGGIINIVLKKNLNSGLNGYVGADYSIGIGKYPAYRPYLSLNYRKKKVGLSGSYSYGWEKNFQDITQERSFTDNGQYHSATSSTGLRNSNNVKLGATYDISNKQYIAIDYTGQFGSYKDTSHSVTNIDYPLHQNNTLSDGIFPSYTKTKFSNIGLNYGITTDSLGSKFTLVSDYTYNDRKGVSGTYSKTFDFNNTVIEDTVFNFLYPSIAKIFTADVKYNKMFKGGMGLSFGGKATVTDINNENSYQNYNNGEWGKIPGLGFNYKYSEKIYAGFVNFNGTVAGVEYKLGLRGENSDIAGTLAGGEQDTVIARNYFNLFPSIFLKKNLNKDESNSLTLSYNRRIKRPSYFELNPYKYFIDNYTIQTGNPFLNPQFTNSVELGYIFKSQYYIGLSYSHTKDVINQVIENDPALKQMTILRKNTGSNTVYTGTFSIPVKITEWWNTSNNLLLTYTESIAPEFSIKEGSFVLQTEQDISLTNGFGINLNGLYTPKVVTGNIVTGRIASVDLGIQKKLMKNKLTAKASISDIFYTNNFKATSYYNESVIRIRQKEQSRVFSLSLVYSFNLGKSFKSKETKSSNAEEKSRLK